MMINRMWRLNSHVKFNFSSAPAPLTDWEYINKIQNSIKHSNINEALRYLVNSHLDGKVLDMHIFRNLYLKIHETKAGLSYEQIVYKLYRQHFKPHILILDWMNSLARSNNPAIMKILQQDYKMLKVDMPKVEKIKQQEQDNVTILKLNSAKKTELTTNPATTTVTRHTVNPNKIIKVGHNEQKQQKNRQSKQINSFPPLQIGEKNISQENINQFIYGMLGTRPKIVIHNVEVEYSNNYDEFDQSDDHGASTHQYSEDKQDDDQFQDFEYVKRIKIGKIQIETGSNIDPFFPNQPEPGKNPKE